MRFAFAHSDPIAFKSDEILKAADKLDARIDIEDVVVFGMPLGITLDTGHFDFERDGGTVVSGFVSDALDEDDLVAIQKLFRVRSKAIIETTTITSADGAIRRLYVLWKVDKVDE